MSNKWTNLGRSQDLWMLVIQIENFTNKTYDDSRYSNLGRIIERSAKTAVILGNFWHNLGYFYLPSGHTDQKTLCRAGSTEREVY